MPIRKLLSSDYNTYELARYNMAATDVVEFCDVNAPYVYDYGNLISTETTKLIVDYSILSAKRRSYQVL